MWVEIEKLVALMADEVVAAAWSAACDSYRLWEFQRRLESCVVDWRDSVDA